MQFILGVSCPKPVLTENASVVAGSSYVYLEKLLIKCALNNESLEIICNANGKWSKNPEDFC